MRFAVASICLFVSSAVAQAAPLELQKGDHICIVGNTLAERMQHFGWLETLIHARFPQHELVFRNLGYSGDEIDGWKNPQHRMRSMDFGTHDQWLSGEAPCPQAKKLSPRDAGKVRENRFELTNTRADVIFAFYGYNESWAGEAGLPAFKKNVEEFIQHTLAQKYNGKSAPRLVLFSPIAHEFIDDPNLPSKEAVAASDARLKMYADAMGEVAKANEVLFVDLFTPISAAHKDDEKTMLLFSNLGIPVRGNMTVNGVHLNDGGDRAVALIAYLTLFPLPVGEPKSSQLEKIHGRERSEQLVTAIRDKNFYWYNRYRVTDGYSTYGDRAFLKFSEGAGGYGEGLSNYSVGQRELEIIDVKTANRDKVVWAAAQGKTVKPDDSNIPEYIPVITNKPGPLPGGKHIFLSGKDSIEKMTVHKGMKVELFADETMFPELVNPVQMAFDTKGRLWVAAWQSYPHWRPTEPMADKLLILEDTNNDGRADVCKTFAGDLHNPTGFEFWGGGVFVAQGPDLLFLKDTDGDDKYDIKERVVHGLDTADTHHTSNSFVLDPGGALYFQEGTFHHSQVETPWGPPRRMANGGVFRYEPRTQKFDIYVTFGFANPHGHAFDAWGQDIVVDGTGSNPFHGPLFSSHLDFPNKHNRPPQVYQQRTRPCPGIEFLSSSHFPESFRGNLLVGNVIGFQGILQYKMQDEGSSLGATELEPIVYSSDPNFRPADLEIGPDGAIWFTDWQNPIIGHMQHNLRDPSRDREHGRVYRVRYEGRELSKPEPIAGRPISELLVRLTSKDDRVRYRVRIELSGRPTSAVIGDELKWLVDGPLSLSEEGHEHKNLEALWLHQSHNVVSVPLLERVLTTPNSNARAAAVRVIAAWHDRLPNALDLLRRAAADSAPRVRLMAIWASSFIPQAEAAEVVLIAQEQPTDQYIEFLSKEVMRTLQPLMDKAKAEGRPLAFKSEAGARFLLKGLTNDDLLKQQRDRLVLSEMLYRPGLRDEHRREAVRELAKLDNKPELRVIMDTILALDGKAANVDTTVVFDLVRQLTSRRAAELTSARAELEKLATSAKQPIFRQIGYVSLINVDDNVEPAWKLATANVSRLIDFVNAMPIISDPNVRATLYDKVEPLLHSLPPELSSPKDRGTVGRFVRVEIPGKATLTLSEVEVFSGGENIARKGRASQKNTAHGGDAAKAIDGGTGGIYGSGNLTHTEENTNNPWWEVDLGDELPIDSIVIWNRTEGELGQRLNNFTIKVLDNGRSEVWKQEKNPAPQRNVTFELAGGGKSTLVRQAAMNALTHVRGQESKTFTTLAKFVKDNVDRVAAIRALQRLPRNSWPKDEADPLLTVLLDHIKKTPAKDRTQPAALDAFEFADALTSLIPADRAKKIRAELGELGVRVIKVGTIFEKMSFDKDVIAVEKGKPVEFLFDNSDLMPHNLVISQPGSLEEIGLASEASAQQPGFAEKQYIPDSPKIILKSKLLQPRDSQRLSFTAPKQPGVYPIVCTYPGHWRRMYAALYVVDDLDEYQANPEAYLAASKLEAVDPLLKDRRPRTEWKLEDLADAVLHIEHEAGRSYTHGKQMFTVANCIGCHKLEGVGREFGADLSKLDPKYKPLDILKEILDPSANINEKYQANTIELSSGKVVTGLVIEETGDVIKLVENPLVKADPIVIQRGDVVDRVKSKTSIMPKGLLDKLTKDEILDLIAYLSARGDKNHSLFKGGHDHAGGH